MSTADSLMGGLSVRTDETPRCFPGLGSPRHAALVRRRRLVLKSVLGHHVDQRGAGWVDQTFKREVEAFSVDYYTGLQADVTARVEMVVAVG